MRNSPLKRSSKRIPKQSKKFRQRFREAKPARQSLIAEVNRCECCGSTHNLCVHEISNGAKRQESLDKRYATLVTCSDCNLFKLTNKGEWPEARQLAALKRSRPQDFNLSAYNTLINPNAMGRITEEEVQAWV